jgi:hypothetical protein
MLLPGKTLENVDRAYKQKRSAAVAKKRTDYVQALNKAYSVRKSQVAGKTPSPVQAKPGKKFQSVRDVPPAVLLPGKTLENVDREYKKRKSAAVAKKRVELSQALNKAYPVRKAQVMASSHSADVDRKKREVEIARQKKIELDKKKSIGDKIVQTKRKLQSIDSSAKKAMSNVEKFQKEIARASQRRDIAKVTKYTRVAEKRKQNLGRARAAQGQLVSQLRQLETMKSNPLAIASSSVKSLSPLKSPSPKMPSPKMPSPKTPSPKIDEQKRKFDEQKRKFDDQKRKVEEQKRKFETQRKMSEQKRKIEAQRKMQQQKMRKPVRMMKRRR